MSNTVESFLRGTVAVAALAASVAAQEESVFEWGGCAVPTRHHNFRVLAGAVVDIEAMVEETTRSLYDVTGSTQKQQNAERYDESDFNMSGPYPSFGISYDVAWRFVTFQVDSVILSASTDATARRNYYLSVGEDIDFQGRSYDHLKIPEGTDFSASFLGNTTELTWSFVPVGLRLNEALRVTPMLDAGVLLFGGWYDIDAGEPVGATQYQNPPVDYVVGGSSSGFVGIGAPQAGPGLEIRAGGPDDVNGLLQVHYLMFVFDGSTEYFTTADHREKNADIDHRNLRIRGQLEFPISDTLCLTAGLQVQYINTEGLISSTATDPDEILEKQERFDKEFQLDMTSVMATVGLTF